MSDLLAGQAAGIWRRSIFSLSTLSPIPTLFSIKLRIIFPLVLGSIDAGTLAKQRELKDAEREYDKLRRELDARLSAARAWEAEVESYYLQARSLGLLPDSASPEAGWNLDKYILELQKVPARVRAMDIPDVQEGTSEAASIELNRIVMEEDQLAQVIGSARRRLDKIEQLSSTVGEYGNNLNSQEDRLLGVGWFEEKVRNAHECPVCSAVHTAINPRLEELQVLAREMKQLTASVHQAPAKLDQEVAVLRLELREQESENILKTAPQHWPRNGSGFDKFIYSLVALSRHWKMSPRVVTWMICAQRCRTWRVRLPY